MSQTVLDEWDEEWDDFTPSIQDQMFEKLEHVENNNNIIVRTY
jgi:hypothetical protein